jgi:undecaprenyl-diphosphatase
MLAWAALVSYSRIHLGVHYPGDVITGAVVGSVLGLIFLKLFWTLKPLISDKR